MVHCFFLGCCREACEIALKQKHLLDDSEIERFNNEVSVSEIEQLEVLERVFEIAAEADTPQEVRIFLSSSSLFLL